MRIRKQHTFGFLGMVSFPLNIADIFQHVIFVETLSKHLRSLSIIVSCSQELTDTLRLTDEKL